MPVTEIVQVLKPNDLAGLKTIFVGFGAECHVWGIQDVEERADDIPDDLNTTKPFAVSTCDIAKISDEVLEAADWVIHLHGENLGLALGKGDAHAVFYGEGHEA